MTRPPALRVLLPALVAALALAASAAGGTPPAEAALDSPRPVPIPEIAPVLPGPVPLPLVQPALPGPVPMPLVRSGDPTLLLVPGGTLRKPGRPDRPPRAQPAAPHRR